MTVELSRVNSSHTLQRRIWHVAGGLLLIAPYGLGVVTRPTYAAVLWILVLLVLAVDVVRLRHPAANALFARALQKLLLPRDLTGLNGTTYFLAGILLAVVLFPRPEAVAGALFLILGDFAAGVVGRGWGRTRLWRSRKSLEGSAACFLTCLALGAAIVGWLPGSAGALAASIVELAETPIDDNLLIPPVAAATLWVFS